MLFPSDTNREVDKFSMQPPYSINKRIVVDDLSICVARDCFWIQFTSNVRWLHICIISSNKKFISCPLAPKNVGALPILRAGWSSSGFNYLLTFNVKLNEERIKHSKKKVTIKNQVYDIHKPLYSYTVNSGEKMCRRRMCVNYLTY